MKVADRTERVLVITTSYPTYEGEGAGHFVRTEVENLRGRGHQVTVLAAGGPHHQIGAHSLGGSLLFGHPGALPRLMRAPWRAAALAAATRSVRRFAAKHNDFDRIICHWLLPSAFPWGLSFGSPQAKKEAVVHGSDLNLFLRLPSALRTSILRTLKRRSFELRFVSRALRSDLERTNLPSDLWAYVASAVVQAPALDVSGAPGKNEARRMLGLLSDERWAVVVGRLIEGKRAHTTLSAATLVPDLKVATIGSGPLEEQLRASYPEVRFLGQLSRPETLKWIAAADLLISSSRLEGAPTAIREARALGTAVITAPSGDTPDWAQSDPHLWIVGEA